MKLEIFGQADAELPEQQFLSRCRLGDPTRADLPAVRLRENNIGALQRAQQRDGLHRRHLLSIFHAPRRWRWNDHRPERAFDSPLVSPTGAARQGSRDGGVSCQHCANANPAARRKQD